MMTSEFRYYPIVFCINCIQVEEEGSHQKPQLLVCLVDASNCMSQSAAISTVQEFLRSQIQEVLRRIFVAFENKLTSEPGSNVGRKLQ